MSVPAIQTSFVSGEVSPSLFGHVDLAKNHSGLGTGRNGFVSYRGGFYSRPGTAFVGFSKQTLRAKPPRLINFQKSINDGLALEFGHQYMRVVSKGAFVTVNSIPITGVTQANPAVVSNAALTGANTATINTASVTQSYAAGDSVTLAGGVFTHPAIASITNTKIVGLQVGIPGGGYVPADTITLAGGTHSTTGIVTVVSTQVVSATIAAAGAGGTNGNAVVTGTTGTGTKFQANVTIAGGALTAVNFIVVPGAYTVNPTLAGELVTGGGLAGATLNLVVGVLTFTISTPGVYTINPIGGVFTQGATSGAGTGAVFRYAIMAPNAVTFSDKGNYTTFPANPVAQSSSNGGGLGATFTVATTSVPAFKNGDWAYITGVNGMIELNGDTYIVAGSTNTTFQLTDVYGNNINSTAFSAWTSGGTAANLFELATPWSEDDLAYLKFTESANTMSLCCLNQETLAEYLPQDQARISDSNWLLKPVIPVPTVSPPASLTIGASAAGNINYQYVVTAVNPVDGTESIASPIIGIIGAVDVSRTAGTIVITWAAVAGVNEYNVYKAAPGFNTQTGNIPSPPVGALFGFIGSAFGTQFADSGISPDFSNVPPQYQNPFARGQIIGAKPTAGGSAYTQIGFTINTSTGSGAVLIGVLVGGTLVAIILNNPGHDYAITDTITVTGDGAGATAVLTVGALTGTYPSVPAYFQQRRVYANSITEPDTYWMSQPGSFTNYNFGIPVVDSDAITGSPWAVQVNGIQHMLPMPGGLVVFTGLTVWQVTGSGGGSLNQQPITPSSQQATPQSSIGCSATVPPIKVDLEILHVQAKNSAYRAVSYQIYTNIYQSTDITLFSSHLFSGHTIREHAWCEEPFKTLHAVRDDGVLLHLTYVKPQEVAGWTRSDTSGLFVSVCAVTEPPVDALYVAVQRFPGTNTAYMIERMDNRLWKTVEDVWAVDCGLTLANPTPNATLTITTGSVTGLGACTSVTGLIGGANYSAGTTAVVVDDNGEGPGTGAVAALTIGGGVITSVSFAGHNGQKYVNPRLDFIDPLRTGSGASARITLDNSVTFNASVPTFSGGDVGKVIRAGGGIGIITGVFDNQHVLANLYSPVTEALGNTGVNMKPAVAGTWSMTMPVSTIRGLRHLAGEIVTGLADGNVIPPTLVPASGVIVLATPASRVTIGLGFQAQVQSTYLETGEPTIQGQRKKIAAVTVRMEASRGLKVGANQPDGSTLSPPQIAAAWDDMTPLADKGVASYNALTQPFFTGDSRETVSGGFQTPGQIAVQQDYPLPMQILAFIPEFLGGDTPQMRFPQKQSKQDAQ